MVFFGALKFKNYVTKLILCCGYSSELSSHDDCNKYLQDWRTYGLALYHTILTFNHLNPLPDDKILDWSKLKQIADDILKSI